MKCIQPSDLKHMHMAARVEMHDLDSCFVFLLPEVSVNSMQIVHSNATYLIHLHI